MLLQAFEIQGYETIAFDDGRPDHMASLVIDLAVANRYSESDIQVFDTQYRVDYRFPVDFRSGPANSFYENPGHNVTF